MTGNIKKDGGRGGGVERQVEPGWFCVLGVGVCLFGWAGYFRCLKAKSLQMVSGFRDVFFELLLKFIRATKK